MAGDTQDGMPETGAVFTFGKSKFADNVPSKFWLKNGVPLKLACGDEHSALIAENGKLFMFGSNNWGQLGLGEKIAVSVPTCVKALKSEKVKLVACGRTHTLVYTSSGNLYAAGGNNEGQLGLGDFEDRTSFQPVEFFAKRRPIEMLAAGSNTSAAITQDGKLYVWGDNSEGQIGLGKEEGTSTPRELDVGSRVTWVSCGYYHSAFVTEDGALYTFGERDSGKLGLAAEQLCDHKAPQRVEGIVERVLRVACGGSHTLALTEKHLYSFGLGQFGQLGHGTFTFETCLPRVVEHFRKGRVKHIECGENHSAVLTERGLLYTFGDGRHGKLALGDEYFANQFKPTLCPRFLSYNVQAVTCGGCHTIVLAKPRLPKSEDVILEDEDVTEDHLEKLLREADSRRGLNRSLSARERRRERKRSPEQPAMMIRTLPPLVSGPRNASLPASSHTLPAQLSEKTTNGVQTNGLRRSSDAVAGERQADEQTSVQNYGDDESVKGLGETADVLNLTHVIKMDAGEKTITLSPVQKKKVKAGEKRSKVVKQLNRDSEWAGLSSDQSASSQLGESESRELRSMESGDRRKAVKERRFVRERRTKSESRLKVKSEPDLRSRVSEIGAKSKGPLGVEVTVQSAKTEIVKEAPDDEADVFSLDDLDQAQTAADTRWHRDTEETRQTEVPAEITEMKKVVREESESEVKTPDKTSEASDGSSGTDPTRKTRFSKPERIPDTQRERLGTSSSSGSTMPCSLTAGVVSLTEDLPIESPEGLLSSQTRDQSPDQHWNSVSEDPEKSVSKRTAVTITVKPAAAVSDEETERSPRGSEDKTEKEEDESGGTMRSERLLKGREKSSSVEYDEEEESETEPEGEVTEKRTNGAKPEDEMEKGTSEEESGKEVDEQMQSWRSESDEDTNEDRSEEEEEEEGEEEDESVSAGKDKSVEESGRESHTGGDMTGGGSENEEQDSEEESEDGEEESGAGTHESEEVEEESEAGKAESEEEEENREEVESGGNEEEDSESGNEGGEDLEEQSEAGTKASNEEKESEAGIEEDESEAGMSESNDDESEAGTSESDDEEESEAGTSKSDDEECEAGTSESDDEEESEAGTSESDDEESKAGTNDSDDEEESEAGMNEEDESEAGTNEEDESETGTNEEDESETGTNEEDESETGTNEEDESEAGTNEEDESEAGTNEQDESEAETNEEDKSEAETNDSNGEEDESEAGTKEEDESEAGTNEEDESEAGTNEEDESKAGTNEEDESEAETNESNGEEDESEAGTNEEDESEAETNERNGEDESEAGVEESEEDKEEGMEGETENEEEEEEDSVEKESSDEEEGGKDESEPEKEGDEDGEEGGRGREQEDEKENEDDDDDDGAIKRGNPQQKELRKRRRRRKGSSGKLRSDSESQEPRQFWDDVLPQYLNLK